MFEEKQPITLNGKPILIHTDTNPQLKDTQNLKVGIKSVHDKAVNNLENFRLAPKNYSSKFREVLLNSRSRFTEHAIFNQNKSMLELQSQIPQTLQLGQD